jgi:hypothetical protein
MEITVKKENGMTITMPIDSDAGAGYVIDAVVEIMLALGYSSVTIERAIRDYTLVER